mgnify:FL=1
MTDADRPTLLQTLLGVYAYYDRDLSELAVSVWFEDLAGHDIAAVCAAFVRHRRDPERGQWLPKSADILRQLQGDNDERRQSAWALVLAEARSVGTYGRPQLTAEQRAAVDAVGGWRALCHCDERELGHMQRRFMAAFDAFDARTEREVGLLGGPAHPAVSAALQGLLQ